jgi:hypothetical protein
VFQTGWYVQDEWAVTRNLTIMPGLRLDVPFLSDAYTNPVLATNEAFRIDTGEVPSGNLLWSPRLGFNWDVDGDTRSIVRGGVGVFTGRPPYVWVSNAYTGNGLSQFEIRCPQGMGPVPVFTPDPNAQPTDCTGGTAPPPARTNQGPIDYFDPDTKYPQNLRFSLGADRKLTESLTASADLLYTRDLNAFYVNDANLVLQGANAEGRAIYGTFGGPDALGARATRIDDEHLGAAIKVNNRSGGRVYSATMQLQQRIGDVADITAGYTYSNSRDRMSLTSSQGFSNLQFAAVDGELDDRNIRPSAFHRPHKITVAGTVKLPYGAAFGLTYVGLSGAPYTWVVNGDVNADGINGNDLPYVPASADDILLEDPSQYAALDAFIESQGCLRASRGQILSRGACRNPWLNLFNLRTSWTSPKVVTGSMENRLEVQFDIFNVLNLLNSDWGLLDQAANFETHGARFLRAEGYDAARQRPIYSFAAPAAVEQTIYSPTNSRWRMQLGLRYTF